MFDRFLLTINLQTTIKACLNVITWELLLIKALGLNNRYKRSQIQNRCTEYWNLARRKFKKKNNDYNKNWKFKNFISNSFSRNAVRNKQRVDWRIFLPTLFGIQLDEVGVTELERDLETIGDRAYLVGLIDGSVTV